MSDTPILERFGDKVVQMEVGRDHYHAVIREEWTFALIVDTTYMDYRTNAWVWAVKGTYFAKGAIRTMTPTDMAVDSIIDKPPATDDDPPF